MAAVSLAIRATDPPPRSLIRLLRLYFIFKSKKKVQLFSKRSTLTHEETMSTCCHHTVVRIMLNFWALIIIPLPSVISGRIKITISRRRETAKKKLSPITVNFEDPSLSDEGLEVDKIGSCGWDFCLSFHRVKHFLRQLKVGLLEFHMKYHILNVFITSIEFIKKSSDRFKDIYKLKLLTRFNVTMTSFLKGVPNYVSNL